jgi:hypothetical protein
VPPQKRRSLVPHEHGAYGQIALPLAVGLAVGRPTLPALLLSGAALAGFMAYEPLLVATGRRGRRAREEDGSRAWRAAGVLSGLAVLLGAPGFLVAPPLARWAALVPPLLAAIVALLVWRGVERTTPGEVAVATALTSPGYPVAIAAGAGPATAGAAWLAWVLGFAAVTLAVQVLLARARGEARDPGARSAMLVVALAALAAGLAARTTVPWTVPAAVAPLALAALAVIGLRPSPRHLKRVGWTILAASLASAAVLVTGLR